MLGGADNPNGELPSYITGADNINDFLVRTGLRSGVSETAVAMFYGSESRDSADVRQCFCRYAPPRQ
ncbi:InsB [Shigella sonnei]|nr:InsB [Shigella sonnei]SIY60279.1 InsB [Shigella sonnei]SIY80857.1 InsB [Shigella sonnei]